MLVMTAVRFVYYLTSAKQEHGDGEAEPASAQPSIAGSQQSLHAPKMASIAKCVPFP
jgi:hypothetical protein